MASLTAGTTFTDGVANDVTAAKLGALVTNATPTSGLIQDRTAETVTATNDTLLIGDASDSNNLKRITVANFAQTLPTAKVTTGTIDTGTFGTTTSTAATITTGTIPTLTTGTTTSTAATITTGTIPTLVATTLVTTGTGTAAAPAIVPTGDTNTGIFFPAADTIAFSEGGAESMRIDSNGNVGIGTANPSRQLSVSGASAALGITSTAAGGNTVSIDPATTANSNTAQIDCSGANALRFNTNSTERLRITSSGDVYVAAGKQIQITGSPGTTGLQLFGQDAAESLIGTMSSQALAFRTNATERLRIDASGNVGIGKTPANKLDIFAASNTGITISNGTMTGVFANSADTSIVVGSQTSHAVNFYTNNLPRMTIDSSGNVGIGTTSPSGTLHSVSTSSSVTPGIFAITATSSTATPAVAVIKQDALNTTNQSFVLFQVGGGTNCGKINANGANTAAFGSTSDARLKENITALPSQIDNVCALRPCEFDYKDGSGHQIGFIAQEMQEVYPDSVGVGDDGMLTITAWSKTEARLVKAIQELKAKNDSLEARLEALESK